MRLLRKLWAWLWRQDSEDGFAEWIRACNPPPPPELANIPKAIYPPQQHPPRRLSVTRGKMDFGSWNADGAGNEGDSSDNWAGRPANGIIWRTVVLNAPFVPRFGHSNRWGMNHTSGLVRRRR